MFSLEEVIEMTESEIKVNLILMYNNDFEIMMGSDYLVFYPKSFSFEPLTTQGIPMYCSHIDTLRRNYFTSLIKSKNIIKNTNDVLGGDDRCGVWIMMKLMDKIKDNAVFAFFDKEETGAVGSNEFMESVDSWIMQYVSCLIGLDRRGSGDAAIYNHTPEKLLGIFEAFGYKMAFGTFTDVSVISSYYSDIPTVNLSVGFFHEHSTSEFVDIGVVNKTLKTCIETHPKLIGFWEEVIEDDHFGFGLKPNKSRYQRLITNSLIPGFDDDDDDEYNQYLLDQYNEANGYNGTDDEYIEWLKQYNKYKNEADYYDEV